MLFSALALTCLPKRFGYLRHQLIRCVALEVLHPRQSPSVGYEGDHGLLLATLDKSEVASYLVHPDQSDCRADFLRPGNRLSSQVCGECLPSLCKLYVPRLDSLPFAVNEQGGVL